MKIKDQVKKLTRRGRSILLNNFWLKLISLLMAFTLWFIVTGGPKREESVSVRLGIERYIPEGWAVAAPYDSEVNLRLRGRGDDIARLLDPGEVNRLVTINLDPSQIELKKGIQRIRLETSDVSLPSGVEVLSIDPPNVLLQIDREVEEEKPVRVLVSGSPREGFRLIGEPVADPARITVTGAKSLVDSIVEVEANVSLTDRDVNNSVIAVTLNRNPLLRYSSNAVEVALDIVEVSERRMISIGPENFDFADGPGQFAVSVDPQAIVLTIEGPASWIRTLQPSDVRMTLNRQIVENLDSRTAVSFSPDLVTFTSSVRRDLVSIKANPSEFYVVVTENQN